MISVDTVDSMIMEDACKGMPKVYHENGDIDVHGTVELRLGILEQEQMRLDEECMKKQHEEAVKILSQEVNNEKN